MNWWERCFASEWKSRGLGLLFVLAGGIVVYAVAPFEEAWNHERYRSPLVIVIPGLFVYLGVIMLVAGRSSGRFMITRHGQEQTRLQQATTAIGAIGIVGLALGFQDAVDFVRVRVAEPPAHATESQPPGSLKRAFVYAGTTYHEPRPDRHLVAVEVSLPNSATTPGFDLDDIEILDGATATNYGSFPEIILVDELGKPSINWSANPLRLLLIYQIPVSVRTVNLKLANRPFSLQAIPIQVEWPPSH